MNNEFKELLGTNRKQRNTRQHSGKIFIKFTYYIIHMYAYDYGTSRKN